MIPKCEKCAGFDSGHLILTSVEAQAPFVLHYCAFRGIKLDVDSSGEIYEVLVEYDTRNGLTDAIVAERPEEVFELLHMAAAAHAQELKEMREFAEKQKLAEMEDGF